MTELDHATTTPSKAVPTSVRSTVAAVVIGLLGVAADLVAHGTDWQAWGLGLDIAVAAAAATAAAAMWQRCRVDRRTLMRVLAVGITIWTAATVLAVVGHRRGISPVWESAALLASAVLLAAGSACRLVRFPPIQRVALAVDAVVMSVATNFVVWELWLRNRPPELGQAAWSLAVMAVMVMVTATAVTLAMHLQQPTRPLVYALMAWSSLAVAGTMALASSMPPALGMLAHHLWSIGAAAGMILLTGVFSASHPPDNQRPEVVRMVAVYTACTASMMLAVQRYILGTYPLSQVSGVLAVVFVVVVTVDQLVRAWESSEYSARLTASLAQLTTSERHLRTMLDDLPEAVIVLDASARIRQVNEIAVEMTGRSAMDLVGLPITSILHEQDRPYIAARWLELQQGEIDAHLTRPRLSLLAPADPDLVVEVDTILPVRDHDHVVLSLRDVTSSLREEAAHERTRERFAHAFRNAPTGMALSTTVDGEISDANEALVRMLAMTRDQLVGRSLRDITHADDRDRSGAMYQRAVSGSIEGYELTHRFVRGDGSTVWAQTWVSVLESDGDVLAIVHIHDITDQRRSAEQLQWAATHDELTRLPNRTQFTTELTDRLASSAVGTTAVLFIDLDNFKVINDSLGHAVGDQLLRGMTRRLRAVLRDHDLLSRFGGDEFIVLLSDYEQDLSPLAAAEQLRVEIGRPLTIDGVELFVTGSIGIAVADRGDVTASDLLRDADAAMYRAKARGRDCVEVFAHGDHESSVATLRTTNELRRGLERDEIVPYYQPIVDLSSGQLKGFEVLARWRHPERGLLGPDQFLPMAEENGLINDVGAAILRASLVQLGRWRETIPALSEISVAVNVSGRQLLERGFDDQVSDALAEAGVPAGSLWLEITETALMADVRAASVALRELRNIGLHLSVDDFGTGYSSLTYLKRFPVEAIKVDRSFVNGLGIDAEDSTIVEAVINLGHSLGLMVVAEGVETPLQLSKLRDLGCDRGQGYLFGRPRPAEIIEAELRVS